MNPSAPVFLFDVESIGLHGEGFAVAGGIFIAGLPVREFLFCCPPSRAAGKESDREWVAENVPTMEPTHEHPHEVRDAFWKEWRNAKEEYPSSSEGVGIEMFAECLWPVEAAFVIAAVKDDQQGGRTWSGPYPFHEVASFMQAAGMDPLKSYERLPAEMPAHHPTGDARQSARLLYQALTKLA